METLVLLLQISTFRLKNISGLSAGGLTVCGRRGRMTVVCSVLSVSLSYFTNFLLDRAVFSLWNLRRNNE